MISWKLPNRCYQPIGLDIGHDSIKMIQLRINSGNISVQAAGRVHIDPSLNEDKQQRRDFIVSKIKEMLANDDFQGRNVVSCLPNGELKMASVRMVEAEDDEVREVLKKEARQRFGMEGDNDSIDYLVAGSVHLGDDVKKEVILFAVEDEIVRDHIAILEEAKLKPIAIDTMPNALFRSFRRAMRRHEDRERTAIFVDVGSLYTTLVLGRKQEISFAKQIPIGGQRFNQALASKLGITSDEAMTLREALQKEMAAESEGNAQSQTNRGGRGVLDASTRQIMIDAVGAVAEELAREISLCLRYYTVTFRGKRIERAVFAGGEAYEEVLLNVLRRRLPVKLETAQPLRGVDLAKSDFADDVRGLFCEWTVAVGLGLRGLDTAKGERESDEGN